MLVFSAGAAGTRVADRPAPRPVAVRSVAIAPPLQHAQHGFGLRPLPFQTGVPAQDAFPAKLRARLRTRAVRANAIAPVTIGRASWWARVCHYVVISVVPVTLKNKQTNYHHYTTQRIKIS